MSGGLAQQAVLFLTDRLDDGVLERFASIEMPLNCEKRILLNARTHRGEIPDTLPITTFDLVDLVRRGFQPMWPGCLTPGSNHFAAVEYAATHPEHKYVWVVENELMFAGKWATLFAAIPPGVDFGATNIRSFDDDPSWPWWKIWCCRPRDRVFPTATQFVASFNSIYRLSHGAASFLKARFLEGWCGHHEVTMATLLYCMGFRIEDFGGNGKFTPAERRGQLYRTGEILRCRPFVETPDVDGRPIRFTIPSR